MLLHIHGEIDLLPLSVAMGFSLQHPLIDLFFLFVFVSLQVRMAVFNQHHVDGLDLTVNPLLYMMRCYPVS